MKPETAHISADHLTQFLISALMAHGMPQASAATLAEVLVWADLRGVSSHGMSRLSMYLRTIRDGDMKPDATPQIENRAGAFRPCARASPCPPAAR